MFPYNDVDKKVVEGFADTVYKIRKIETLINHKKSRRTVEAITVALRFLQQEYNFAFKHATFCECMGFAAEACCYAAAFGFKSLVSIEISEDSRKLGYVYLRMLGETEAASFTSVTSRFHERMAVDADITYFDTEHLGDLDEGVMIQSYLDCTRSLLPGTFAILITRSSVFKLSDWNVNWLKMILPTTVAKGNNDEGYMWLMQRINPKE